MNPSINEDLHNVNNLEDICNDMQLQIYQSLILDKTTTQK
jgi:hypothetical protein